MSKLFVSRRTRAAAWVILLVLPALTGVKGLWLATFAAEGCALAVSLIFTLVNRKKYGYF